MQKRNEVLRSRITKLIKGLISLEMKQHGGSEADALERLILRGSTSEDAIALAAEEASKDPQFAPLVHLLTQGQKANKGKKNV